MLDAKHPPELRAWCAELARLERWADLGVPPPVAELTLTEMEALCAIRSWKLEKQWSTE